MSKNSSDAGCISGNLEDILNCQGGSAKSSFGITTKAFALNLAVGLALFAFNLTGFFLLKSSALGRRIYQPKTYLVPERVRVETIPANPVRWIRRIFTINGEELKLKCGLDGYFFIRFIRAMIIVFVPLMVIIVTVLLPINYNGGRAGHSYVVAGQRRPSTITGLDTLSMQNVAPTQTDRYWAHLVCAILAISWTLYRIYREKLHYIEIRQQFLLSPEHRLKASARTVLITNIPSEYRSDESLKAFFDVFVDNDDRSRLHVWVNRDYRSLKTLVMRRRKLRHALEKAELKVLRSANKLYQKSEAGEALEKLALPPSSDPPPSRDGMHSLRKHAIKEIANAFDSDCREQEQLWEQVPKIAKKARVTIVEDDAGNWNTVSSLQLRHRGQRRSVPKVSWLRFEIARITIQIEDMMRNVNNENVFARLNSAFIQFDRQMSANMACSLISHHQPGKMTPRFLDVAPHEILWPNMGVTSFGRFIGTCMAIALFLLMIVLWGIPATFLGTLSQLEVVRQTASWAFFLKSWPDWIISLISGTLEALQSSGVLNNNLTWFRSACGDIVGLAGPAGRASVVSHPQRNLMFSTSCCASKHCFKYC